MGSVLKMGKISNKKKIKEILGRIVKMLIRRDLELTEIREEREKEIVELDRIAQMIARRDSELLEIQEKRETELKELKEKTKELEEVKVALMNILEDVEEARQKAEEEKEKTLAIITNFADGLLVSIKKINFL